MRSDSTHRSMFAAHPRSRGEHPAAAIVPVKALGSSPLARGTCEYLHYRGQRLRLIPARAGNIVSAKPLRVPSKAHPRSRGEHVRNNCVITPDTGSSPLARGTFHRAGRQEAPQRLIPARAGNILADMGVYPLHQQNRITLKPEPHPGYTINSHS